MHAAQRTYRRRLAVCEACAHLQRDRCGRHGVNVHEAARRPARACDLWPEPIREAEAERGDRPDLTNVRWSTLRGDSRIRRFPELPVGRLPFGREPTRHLLYHVYPVTGNGLWQRNLDLLLERIELFNGRRLVAIAVDAETDSAEAVLRHCGRAVSEWLVVENNPHAGELVTFLPLLAQVQTDDPDVVTFRAHAKGTSRPGAAARPHLLEWIDLLYRTNLDAWDDVAADLEAHAFTGAFRETARFRAGAPTYSGSFYWFRNCFVYGRDWWALDGRRWAAESWPGRLCAPAETGCLFADEPGSLYDPATWRKQIRPRYAAWLADHAWTTGTENQG